MVKQLKYHIIFLLELLFMFSSPVFAQSIQSWGNCVTPEGVPTFSCLEIVFGNLVTIASGLVILVLFVMFVIGGFNYLTSFGNPEKIKKAQGTLKYALLGFVLFLSSYLILKIIDALFLGNQGHIFEFNLH